MINNLCINFWLDVGVDDERFMQPIMSLEGINNARAPNFSAWLAKLIGLDCLDFGGGRRRSRLLKFRSLVNLSPNFHH